MTQIFSDYEKITDDHWTATFGLTKRELFASMAMVGMLASESSEEYYPNPELVRSAVKKADALIKELEKPDE